jgi:uncharacterized protein
MNIKLKNQLIGIVHQYIDESDISHDFIHTQLVLRNAEQIAKQEKADRDIVVAAALFHDIIVYPKNSADTCKSQHDSAKLAAKILKTIKEFPAVKIEAVKKCILECSFTQNLPPSSLESKVLQDADLLESTGAISIMRTFASAALMKRRFFNIEDPFCKKRIVNNQKFATDLFFLRLLKAGQRIKTKTAKKIAVRRTKFLKQFLKELGKEIYEKFEN